MAYKFAVAAVVTGSFSLLEAGPEFVAHRPRRHRHRRGGRSRRSPPSGGAWTTRRPRSRSRCSPPTPPTCRRRSSGASGVIAAVTVGVWLGWQASELTTATTRLQLVRRLGDPPVPAQRLPVRPDRAAAARGAGGHRGPLGRRAGRRTGRSIAVLVIVVRIVWVYALTYLPRRSCRGCASGIPPPRPERVDAGGLEQHARRGVLAAALAIPLRTDAGGPSPSGTSSSSSRSAHPRRPSSARGSLFPALIRAAGHRGRPPGQRRGAERPARDRLRRPRPDRRARATRSGCHEDTVERVRRCYEYRRRRFRSQVRRRSRRRRHRAPETTSVGPTATGASWREVIGAERRTLRRLRDEGAITDEVRRRIEYDLDLEEARLEASARPRAGSAWRGRSGRPRRRARCR